MEAQLISVNDLGYLRHNRAHANRYHHARRNRNVDSVARDFQKLLALLERDLIAWFGRLTKSKSERILKHKCAHGVLKYQEIDFIAESEFGLKFCELKLKSKFKPDLSERQSGFAQLRVTTEAAASAYSLNGALAISVDMSFIYTGDNSQGQDFARVENLPDYFQRQGSNQHLWLDMKDILSVALLEGWMTPKRIDEIRQAYDMLNNPMSMLPKPHQIPLNNPFVDLRQTLAS